MHPIPKFSTEQIALRPFTKDDVPALRAALNHPELSGRKYIPWDFNDELPLTIAQVEKVIEKWQEQEEGFCYAVIQQSDQRIVGHASVSGDWDPHMPGVSLVIYPNSQHQGYGAQVMRLLLDYLVDFTVAHNISTWVEEWNDAGLAFVEKFGFTRVGTVRRDEFRGGQYVNSAVFDILRPEWKERRHAA